MLDGITNLYMLLEKGIKLVDCRGGPRPRAAWANSNTSPLPPAPKPLRPGRRRRPPRPVLLLPPGSSPPVRPARRPPHPPLAASAAPSRPPLAPSPPLPQAAARRPPASTFSAGRRPDFLPGCPPAAVYFCGPARLPASSSGSPRRGSARTGAQPHTRARLPACGDKPAIWQASPPRQSADRSIIKVVCNCLPIIKLMDMPGPRWKKGKNGKDFAALAEANPISTIISQLQTSLKASKPVATLSAQGGDAILGVKPEQAVLFNRASFGRAVENVGLGGSEKQWFQLGPEEVFYLCHALKCIAVKSENKNWMGGRELWDHLSSMSESFPEMYKAYSHLRSKNWVVRSGLQYGADFVAYRHHPALVHSEFAVVVVPEGKTFGSRCSRLKVWSDLLCALRASGSVAKTLLLLTISSSCCELSSPDCLPQLIVHERVITRWIPQQCREQQCEPFREEAIAEGLDPKRECVVFNYWAVILGFTVISSLIVYKLKS